MRPFGIVVVQILRNLFLPELQVAWDTPDALILDGSVEPLKVGIVIRRTQPSLGRYGKILPCHHFFILDSVFGESPLLGFEKNHVFA